MTRDGWFTLGVLVAFLGLVFGADWLWYRADRRRLRDLTNRAMRHRQDNTP